MIQRNDACNQFAGSIEITETDRWLRSKRQEGCKGLGMLHLFIAGYIASSQLPGLNRFVAGQKIYARNEILVSMMVKRGIDGVEDLRQRSSLSRRTPSTTSTR